MERVYFLTVDYLWCSEHNSYENSCQADSKKHILLRGCGKGHDQALINTWLLQGSFQLSVFSILHFSSSVKTLFSALVYFAVPCVPEDIYLRSQMTPVEAREVWCSGKHALEAERYNLMSKERPSERSEHGPVICRPTEETHIKDLIKLN